VRVQLLYFNGCPHAEGARAVLQSTLQSLGLPIAFEEVDTTAPETPPSLRGWGSPTFLIDGQDPFGGAPGHGTTCRLYSGTQGAPSEPELRAALATMRGGAPDESPLRAVPDLDAEVDDDSAE